MIISLNAKSIHKCLSYSVSSEIGAFSPADKASNVEESYDNEAFQNDSDSSPVGNGINTPDEKGDNDQIQAEDEK